MAASRGIMRPHAGGVTAMAVGASPQLIEEGDQGKLEEEQEHEGTGDKLHAVEGAGQQPLQDVIFATGGEDCSVSDHTTISCISYGLTQCHARVSIVKQAEHDDGTASLEFKEKVFVFYILSHILTTQLVHARGAYKRHHRHCPRGRHAGGLAPVVIA
eukprot:755416-Hanusia_phi.AAC.5